MYHGKSNGIILKKRYGQHFLRDHTIIEKIVQGTTLTNTSSVFEIGCGDGVLTKAIINTRIARLWVFEIDEEWAEHVKNEIQDNRLTMHTQNILDIDIEIFKAQAPWTLLANLPYQITFPILHLLYSMRHLLKEGIIMIQEEVAEKILKKSGRGYGYPSLFFQRYFEWKKMDKVPATAFYPPPKVESRLLYFKPRESDQIKPIENEEKFWIFIKCCFKSPRRTLRNNLTHTNYLWQSIPEETLALRAQQLTMEDLVSLWNSIPN